MPAAVQRHHAVARGGKWADLALKTAPVLPVAVQQQQGVRRRVVAIVAVVKIGVPSLQIARLAGLDPLLCHCVDPLSFCSPAPAWAPRSPDRQAAGSLSV